MLIHLHDMLCHSCGPHPILYTSFHLHLHGCWCLFFLPQFQDTEWVHCQKLVYFTYNVLNLVLFGNLMVYHFSMLHLIVCAFVNICFKRVGKTSKSDICCCNESVLWKSREVCFSSKEWPKERRLSVPLNELAGWGYFSSNETWNWFETLWFFDTESSEDCGITVILVTAPAYWWKQQS